jgi:hypothetical protein
LAVEDPNTKRVYVLVDELQFNAARRGGNRVIPNPLDHLLASTAKVALHLNESEYVSRRGRMITLLNELEKLRPDLHGAWLSHPENLPDLSRLRPPGGNARKAGIKQSHFERRKQGRLPSRY